MKKLELTEEQTQGLVNELGEIPAKWSIGIIGKIQSLFAEQNPEEEVCQESEDSL